MRKKKIFITTQYMGLDGAVKALVNLLHNFDYDHYEVDLFLYKHDGDLMMDINPNVNLISEISEYAHIYEPIVKCIKSRYYKISYARLKSKMQAFLFSREKKNFSIHQYVGSNTIRLLPKITDKCYDLAISFLHPHNLVIDKISAKKKIAWIHTDYSNLIINKNKELPIWSAYDHIASISPLSTKAFIEKFPELKSKVIEIENIISKKTVLADADKFNVSLDGELVFLTVARFDYAKGIDIAIKICRHLLDLGLNLKWYLIGHGNVDLVKQMISDHNLHDNFILLGKKHNPYPYMKACDFYVQPSRFEGKSLAVREAQLLGKPVIITNYSSAPSQLTNSVDGFIVSLNPSDAAKQILSIVHDKKLVDIVKNYCDLCIHGNESEIVKIYEIID